LTLTGTLISDNYASFTGAGIWMSNGQGANTISNCTIINNEASYGGGMYISFSSVSITDNDIGGNTAAIGGAAMFATSANITFVDNNVTNNSSTTSDGVVSIAQSVKVKDKDGNEMTTEEEILAVNDFSDNTPGGVQFTES
jgi:parallel beta-helix repeat protein